MLYTKGVAIFANKPGAAQDFVPIREVRDGLIVLNDGSMRAVLLTSSINFALKDQATQEAIISQFQNFLNGLDFSLQIFIESRRLDIRPYIVQLETRYREEKVDLMKIQTREYIDFIKSFTESTNIMNKSFFVVVPYTPPILTAKKSFKFLSFGGKKNAKEAREDSDRLFSENRAELEQRIAVVEQNLLRTGVRVVQLGTEEIIELFYKLFNPGETEKPIPMEAE